MGTNRILDDSMESNLLAEEKRKGQWNRIHLIAILISFSSFTWGYTFSVLNVCMVPDARGSILNDIPLTKDEEGYVTALVLIGAWVSSILADAPTEKYGRKPVFLVSNLFFFVGALICGLAPSLPLLYLGRAILGFACGIVTIVSPVLLTEIAPTSIRGQITTLHQLQITFGILGSSLLGYVLVSYSSVGWRWLNLFIVVPVLIQTFFFKYLPESPRWLLGKNLISQAEKTQQLLNPHMDMSEIREENAQICFEMKQKESPATFSSWKLLLQYKKKVCIGALIFFFQAMTGANTVIFYSSKIFLLARVNEPILATTTVNAVNVIMTFISIKLIDKCGRKILMVVGTIAMCIALTALGFTLFFLNSNVQLQGIIAVGCTLIFIAGFACGLGAVSWVAVAELLPTSIRSKGFGIAIAVNYLCNIFIATYTLKIISWFGSGEDPEKNGTAKLYICCAVISFIAVLFLVSCVPETKGLSLDSEDTFPPIVSSEESSLEEDVLLHEENSSVNKEE